MKISSRFIVICAILTCVALPHYSNGETNILTEEENLWLKSRNNTIVIYPEKNFPPYSYQNTAGSPQGLSIDYIELIAEKIGAKIQYLPARSRSQVIEDVQQNKKGDVITSISDTKEREEFFYFTDTYMTVPSVIVVRKDLNVGSTVTLNDLSGKKVAIGKDYAVGDFVHTTNSRIIIESVVDNESGLQQVVLGEVDAAVMDIASLSYYLSKQVLNSVKVVGNTGYESNFSFAVPKDKEILQSILDKGLQQISTRDRQILNDKWISVPHDKNQKSSFVTLIYSNISGVLSYVLLSIAVIVIIVLLQRGRSKFTIRHTRKKEALRELENEIADLEDTSKDLMEELQTVKKLESNIQQKIKEIDY